MCLKRIECGYESLFGGRSAPSCRSHVSILVTNEWTIDERAQAVLGIDAGSGRELQAWARALHPDDRDRAVLKFDDVLRTSMSYEMEYRIVWPNGQVRHVLERGLSSGPVGGPPTRVDGIFSDITELRVAEQLGQRLLEAAPDAMVVPMPADRS
jgi:PAS domain-containing protein